MNIKDEKKRLGQYPTCEKDDLPDERGILLSDKIKHYVETCKMITPFDEMNLKPAAYELTVGEEYAKGKDIHSLGDNEQIKLEPFEVAIIETAETINLPRFIVGKWDIRVSWAYKGLLWVGGPQVDPGWVGHLFFPVYNLSENLIRISRGEHIAVMEFVKTTEYNNGSSQAYPRPPKRVTLSEYLEISGIGEGALYKKFTKDFSDPINRAIYSVENIRKESENTSRKLDDYFMIMLTVVALVVTSLVIIATSSLKSHYISYWWTFFAVGVSVFSLIVSFIRYKRPPHMGRESGGKENDDKH